MHLTLRDWRARRAGGAITVSGNNAFGGEPVKISSVVQLSVGKIRSEGLWARQKPCIIARHQDGTEHVLLLD